MSPPGRRTVLKELCAGVFGIAGGCASAVPASPPKKGRIRKIGHSLLSDSPGGFAEEAIRSDGQYAVLGTVRGPVGSFLVDIRDPTNPREVHTVPSPTFYTGHWDVKFDHRDGLYYRSLQDANLGTDATFAVGFEVIDYGFEDGTPEEPVVRARADAGSTHNLFAHDEEPILYTDTFNVDRGGFDVWDVSDPGEPVRLRTTGIEDAHLHDIVVDPERDLAHCAYLHGDFDGYVIMDASDPADPVEIGRFDYDGHPDYSDVAIGEEAFENCHLAKYDPEREITVVGDEVPLGNPGGKHVFDVSEPSDPQPIGYTTSPNADHQVGDEDWGDWTGHNFDIVPKGKTTVLVSGDYHEGTVVYDISDPTDPVPTDRYPTDDEADEASQPFFPFGEPPWAWGADYSATRDLVVTSDIATGLYTFKVTPDASAT